MFTFVSPLLLFFFSLFPFFLKLSFIVCNSAKCISLDFVSLLVFVFFFREDGRLEKIKYFIVIWRKGFRSAGQDFLLVVDFSRNTVRVFYPSRCLSNCAVVSIGNLESWVYNSQTIDHDMNA